MTEADVEVAHRQLVNHLIDNGALTPDWRSAFEAVHRAEFIPETVWVEGDGGVMVPLRRVDDPVSWLELAYADDAGVTQVDDGHPAQEGVGRRISSSASMPTVVAQMLGHADAQPGHRVLEIGTGTGYNAAPSPGRSTPAPPPCRRWCWGCWRSSTSPTGTACWRSAPAPAPATTPPCRVPG